MVRFGVHPSFLWIGVWGWVATAAFSLPIAYGQDLSQKDYHAWVKIMETLNGRESFSRSVCPASDPPRRAVKGRTPGLPPEVQAAIADAYKCSPKIHHGVNFFPKNFNCDGIFYERPNGCTGAPDLDYQEVCNTHDICFMKTPGTGVSFSEHFNACNAEFKGNLKAKFARDKKINVAGIYKAAVQLLGYQKFLNSQADQIAYLHRLRLRLGVAIFHSNRGTPVEKLRSQVNQQIQNFCNSVRREESENPRALSESRAPEVAQRVCPPPVAVLRQASH